MGMKHHDIFGAFGCSSCHDYVDGRYKHKGKSAEYSDRMLYLYEGIQRTQAIWLEEAFISVK